MTTSPFIDPYDVTFARGAASAVARSIRLRVEAARQEVGERTADNRQKARWQAQISLADYVEQTGDADPGVVAIAAAHRARGGQPSTWSAGPAQEKVLGFVLADPKAKRAPASDQLLAALASAAVQDAHEHAKSLRNDELERDLGVALRDVTHAQERAQSIETELRLAHEREDAQHEQAALKQAEVDDLRQRLAGVVNGWTEPGPSALAVEAARNAVRAPDSEAKAA